ncbi:c-type cytochrome [Bordetella genomosp. 1]|uniref:Cytochrome C n=2 Tax=Bordetella genomosp. 1 TaxID=1395607 RepID=A0ABX4EZY0_9BORD|nr:cytochrome c [Bordetella genomosp. 1]MDQ8033643.1 cytochrome c [Bordetella sp.]OZI65307.1 cytochrome C [Bordetella genomosp. 1]
MKFNNSMKCKLYVLLSLLASCSISGQALAADAAATAGSAENARDKVSMCIGCHGIPGYKASFPELYHVPMIAGQNAKYIEAALTEYKKGSRSHPTMDAIAGSLSDQDIADLAAYYSNLK